MRAFAAVFRREIAEYRLIFPAAILIGLVALAAPWLPGTGGQRAAELRGAAALSLAVIVAFVLAVVLGSSVLARDLAERRLGFYFARPLPGWALWSGKLLAAVVLALAAGALVLLPALLAGGRLEPGGYWWLGGLQPENAAELVPLLILGALALLLAAHALSTMVRARSPWLLLDLAAALAVAAAFLACRESLLGDNAVEAFSWGATFFLLTTLVSAAAASAVQVLRGRTDLRRGHRLLSLTLWGCLGAASAAFAGYTGWVLHVEPEDLTRLDAVVPAPAGTWVALTGQAAGRGSHYYPAFLFDVASGRYFRIRSMDYPWWDPSVFSTDGRRAVWLDHRTRSLVSLDLARPGAEPVVSQVVYQDLPRHVTVSPDGTRVAALFGDRLTVDDLAAGRLLASVKGSFDYGDRVRFVDNRRVRIFRSSRELARGSLAESWQLEVLDFDLATRRLRQIARLSSLGRPWALSSPDEDRVLLRRFPAEMQLVQLSTGKVLATMPGGPLVTERFLADGKIALVARDPSRRRVTLTVLDQNGAELSRATFAANRLLIGGQPVPESLVVATSRARPNPAPGLWTSWQVEIATGRLREIGPGLLPVMARAAGPRSVASRLFATGDGGLVLVDPVTGRRRTVLEPGS